METKAWCLDLSEEQIVLDKSEYRVLYDYAHERKSFGKRWELPARSRSTYDLSRRIKKATRVLGLRLMEIHRYRDHLGHDPHNEIRESKLLSDVGGESHGIPSFAEFYDKTRIDSPAYRHLAILLKLVNPNDFDKRMFEELDACELHCRGCGEPTDFCWIHNDNPKIQQVIDRIYEIEKPDIDNYNYDHHIPMFPREIRLCTQCTSVVESAILHEEQGQAVIMWAYAKHLYDLEFLEVVFGLAFGIEITKALYKSAHLRQVYVVGNDFVFNMFEKWGLLDCAPRFRDVFKDKVEWLEQVGKPELPKLEERKRPCSICREPMATTRNNRYAVTCESCANELRHFL